MMGATSASAWPRGTPLPDVTDPKSFMVGRRAAAVPYADVAVWQSLADHDPDVDAIYRLLVR
jgi:hypothetical protein